MVAAAQRRAHCAPVVEDILGGRRPGAGQAARGADDEAPEGPLMAFKKGDERVLVHQACASCSSEVYWTCSRDSATCCFRVKRRRASSARVKMLAAEEIRRDGGLPAASGAGGYHVRCCLDIGWTFGPNKTLFCPVHRRATTTPRICRMIGDVRLRLRPEGLNFDDGTAMYARRGSCSTRPARAAPRTRRRPTTTRASAAEALRREPLSLPPIA